MKPKLRLILIFVLFFTIQASQASFLSAAQQKDNQIGLWKKIPNAPLAVPNSRIGKELVGNKLIVWGGEKSDKPLSDGAVYDIDKDTWKKMAAAPMEGAEHGTMIAYGKNEVIIWGGTPIGAIYNTDKDTWKKMAAAPITLGAEPYTSGLLGNKLFVWGIGKTRDLNPVGGIYDIGKDTWKKIADLLMIKAIDDWPPLFYKNKFIVWGAPSAAKGDRYGAIYDIDKDEWKEMAKAPIERRNWSASVLVGNKLIIWGGCPGPVEANTKLSFADGAVYDIDKDTWKMMAGAPLKARFLPRSFVWGKKVIIWGGFKDEFDYDGAIYDVEKDAWKKIPDAPLVGIGARGRELYNYGIFGYNPTPPGLLGDKLIVWGGEGTVVGAIFDLKNDKWEEIAAAPFGGRDYHASFLYRSKLIIWGGVDAKGAHADGAIYNIGN